MKLFFECDAWTPDIKSEFPDVVNDSKPGVHGRKMQFHQVLSRLLEHWLSV